MEGPIEKRNGTVHMAGFAVRTLVFQELTDIRKKLVVDRTAVKVPNPCLHRENIRRASYFLAIISRSLDQPPRALGGYVLKEWKWAEDAALERHKEDVLLSRSSWTIRPGMRALSTRLIETSTGRGFVTGGCRPNSSTF